MLDRHPAPPLKAESVKMKSGSSSFRKLLSIGFVVLEVLSFVTLGLVLVLRGAENVYKEYYVPLMNRATRTDSQLRDEYTYYRRSCTSADLPTTQDPSDVLADFEAPVEKGVDQIMSHGALLLPGLLPLDKVQNLREYAVYRNRVIPEHEEYPVSQGENRKSFGYEAAEHPALVDAIQHITQNKYVHNLLSQLLGDHDPASTEITTITQYYGASQMYWHPDTKPQGNALQFARTYSHSYSLFVSLQNTTHEMGATQFCLGSHYCADRDLSELCAKNPVGLDSTTIAQNNRTTTAFVAGDGALFNQHVWHRAPPHLDPEAPERIMFVLSFLARPRPTLDQRQLSRGTYFHQKWNMWGHTWQDLTQPHKYMIAPFTILKCLALWNPSGRNWGYDLVTATFMRFSNAQLGHGLTRFVSIWDNVLKWPTWLHGSNLEYDVPEKQAWKTFIEETLHILMQWVYRGAILVYLAFLMLQLGVFTIASFADDPTRTSFRQLAWQSTKRLIGMNVLLFALFSHTLHQLRVSPWGKDVLSGQVLKRPFPPVSIWRDEEERVMTDLSGPTTLPIARDVLLGTRFDAPWLGAYERWLDWHPGNRRFLKALKQYAPDFTYYKNASPIFQNNIRNTIRDNVTRNGARFLRQDYRTGDWRILNLVDQDEILNQELVYASRPALQHLNRAFKRMIALYRFTSVYREAWLARSSVVYLILLQKRWVLPWLANGQEANKKLSQQRVQGAKAKPFVLPMALTKDSHRQGTFKTRPFVLPIPVAKEPFPNGYPVWVRDPKEDDELPPRWLKGDVLGLFDYGDDDDDDELLYYDVALEASRRVVSVIRPKARYKPITQGDFVLACCNSDKHASWLETEDEDCHRPAEVLRVMPNGIIDAVYGDVSGYWDMEEEDDDESQTRIVQCRPEEYYKPPFKPRPAREDEDEEDEDEEEDD